MKLIAAGISHKTAPVELREQLAVQLSEVDNLARYLKCFGHFDEIALLSTCNRVEIYGTTRQSIDNIKPVLQLISSEPVDLGPHIYVHKDADAARHLFRVTAGLDSMMLGETEITGQVKNAYETARTAGLTGRTLNRLFQKAFQATKEIRTRTRIGRGAVSLKGAAVQLLEKIVGDDLADKSIMVLGAGQVAERCVRLLVDKGVGSIFVSNRSFDRATDLAMRCGGDAVCFGYCLFEMREVDAVIAATSSAEPLLDHDDIAHLMTARHNRPLVLIDLSVPRNIDPTVATLQGVSLYNIDDLEERARKGVRNRERELSVCDAIIDAHLSALMDKPRPDVKRLYPIGRGGRSLLVPRTNALDLLLPAS